MPPPPPFVRAVPCMPSTAECSTPSSCMHVGRHISNDFFVAQLSCLPPPACSKRKTMAASSTACCLRVVIAVQRQCRCAHSSWCMRRANERRDRLSPPHSVSHFRRLAAPKSAGPTLLRCCSTSRAEASADAAATPVQQVRPAAAAAATAACCGCLHAAAAATLWLCISYK